METEELHVNKIKRLLGMLATPVFMKNQLQFQRINLFSASRSINHKVFHENIYGLHTSSMKSMT